MFDLHIYLYSYVSEVKEKKSLGQIRILRANNLRISALGHLPESALPTATVYLALSDASNALRQLAIKFKYQRPTCRPRSG